MSAESTLRIQDCGAPDLLFTVFTPTYNRAKTLGRVYDSLCSQTVRNFEWLIVDDGSTDGTIDLVLDWSRAADFPIRYVRQTNQGKHVATNRGVAEARGELFLTLDSDDGCVDTVLQQFATLWQAIPERSRSQFSAVTALCQDQHGNIVGEKFPQDILDSDSLELHYRFKVRGEKWGFQRTDVMRKFPFPDLSGERFIPESVVWYAIARNYKTRFVNVPLRIYWIRSAQDDDAGAPSKDLRTHARGHAYAHQCILNEDVDWFQVAPAGFFRSGVHYVRFSFHDAVGPLAQYKHLTNPLAKMIWLASFPVGLLVYLRDISRRTA
jgi:glycosyltransferase involved in cell wall biosynthesis